MNILLYLLEKYPDKDWSWNYISRNPNITIDIIETHPDKDWSWNYISCNPNITMEFIEKHPEKPWTWNGISQNPNITMEMIEKHIDKIDFEYLSKNKFTFENTRIKKKEGYLLLEKDRSFHKLMNLYVIKKYM